MKISIIGAGMFGFAMANYLAKNDCNEIYLYDVDESLINYINENRRHKFHFKDVVVKENIKPKTNLSEVMSDTNLIILSVPSQFMRSCIKNISPFVKTGSVLLNLSKGLENGTDELMSKVIYEELSDLDAKVVTLSGGMIAKEFAMEMPLAATIASSCNESLDFIKGLLKSNTFHIVKSHDHIGVELAGPLKNIIAILCGAANEKGYGASSIGCFLSSFSKEAESIAIALGANKDTFSMSSPAWAGDIIATCFGNSRNRDFGAKIASGINVDNAIKLMKEENKLVEGFVTTKVFHDIAKHNKLDTPIIEEIYRMLYENKDPELVLKSLNELMN